MSLKKSRLSLSSAKYLEKWPYSRGGWDTPLVLCYDPETNTEIMWVYDTLLINRVPEVLRWPCFVYIEWERFDALHGRARTAEVTSRRRACIAESKARRFDPDRRAGSIYVPLRHYTEEGDKI